MKGLVSAAVLAAVMTGAAETVWTDDFSKQENWPGFWDMNKTIRREFGAKRDGMGSCVAVKGTIKDPEKLHWAQRDTAWHITSAKKPVATALPKYAVSYRARGLTKKSGQVVGASGYYSAIIWYDAAGDQIEMRGIPMYFAVDGSVNDVRFVDRIPAGAASFSVRLGVDAPNLFDGEELCFSDAKLETLGEEAVCGALLRDVDPPTVTLRDAKPSEDRNRSLVLDVSDPSGVDWRDYKITIDGRDAKALFTRAGDTLTLAKPSEPWSPVRHRIDIDIADKAGNRAGRRQWFFIGRDSGMPRVTLRDDGVTLVDGKPFFPIGMYSVKKTAFNRWNLDTAVRDLAAAGFNTIHSYTDCFSPEFTAALDRYGMKTFLDTHPEHKDMIAKWRFDPAIIAWYIGDDTSSHFKPYAFLDRYQGVRAADTARLVCQADVIHPDSPVDNYENYAAGSDVFLPELYPVMEGKPPAKGKNGCVASIVGAMRRIRADNAAKGGGRPHAVWPIIQNFIGWDCWHRYPTAAEVEGMSYASIIHGAKGITWYSYGGAAKVWEKKQTGFGVADSPEAWTICTNLSAKLSRLAPVLVERDAARQPSVPEIVKGPRRQGGVESVTGLLKVHKGTYCYLTVNCADAEVTAKIRLGDFGVRPGAKVQVLGGGEIEAAADGSLSTDYGPLAVRIYRWK